ncbi:MAG: DUF5615 family PIN-like protein [Acidimicrobiales bacterium]
MSSKRSQPPDSLLLDEMFSPAIAATLIERGPDCAAVAARPVLRSLDDRDVIEAALEEGRILVTNNVRDFERLRREREANAAAVPGLIYTSDDAFPRSRAFLDRISAALEDAACRHLVIAYGGVFWLKPLELEEKP